MISPKRAELEKAVQDAVAQVDQVWRVWRELLVDEAEEVHRETPRSTILSLLKLARGAERNAVQRVSSGNTPRPKSQREPPPRSLREPSKITPPADMSYALDGTNAYRQLKKAFEDAKTPEQRERVRKIAHRLVAQGLVTDDEVLPFLRVPPSSRRKPSP